MDRQTEEMFEERQEEKVNVERVINECDFDKNPDISSLEFHNCIILNGIGELNAVLNKGTINGNLSQGYAETADNYRKEARSVFYDFSDEIQIRAFIRDYAQRLELCTLLSVAFLKLLPEFLWVQTRDLLFICLHGRKEGVSDPERNPCFSNTEEELELLHMIAVPAKCTLGRRSVQTRCILFFDEKVGKRIVKMIWQQYQGVKASVYEWLLALGKQKMISDVLAYQISNAFGETLLYDRNFFDCEIFRKFAREKGNSNRNYLVSAWTYFLKNSSYDETADKEVLSWIAENDEFLWEVAYRLYGVNLEYSFNKKIENRLEDYFLIDQKRRCLGEGVYRSGQNPRVDLYPAYFRMEMQQMILTVLTKIFYKCTTYQEKVDFANYFVWLLTTDYKMEGYPKYELIFVSSLRQKEVRVTVRAMYLELWRTYRVRNVWMKILEKHFVELERNEKSWSYMKDFFKVLAFTGKREEFEEMQKILKNMCLSKSIAEKIGTWLYALLRERGAEV